MLLTEEKLTRPIQEGIATASFPCGRMDRRRVWVRRLWVQVHSWLCQHLAEALHWWTCGQGDSQVCSWWLHHQEADRGEQDINRKPFVVGQADPTWPSVHGFPSTEASERSFCWRPQEDQQGLWTWPKHMPDKASAWGPSLRMRSLSSPSMTPPGAMSTPTFKSWRDLHGMEDINLLPNLEAWYSLQRRRSLVMVMELSAWWIGKAKQVNVSADRLLLERRWLVVMAWRVLFSWGASFCPSRKGEWSVRLRVDSSRLFMLWLIARASSTTSIEKESQRLLLRKDWQLIWRVFVKSWWGKLVFSGLRPTVEPSSPRRKNHADHLFTGCRLICNWQISWRNNWIPLSGGKMIGRGSFDFPLRRVASPTPWFEGFETSVNAQHVSFAWHVRNGDTTGLVWLTGPLGTRVRQQYENDAVRHAVASTSLIWRINNHLYVIPLWFGWWTALTLTHPHFDFHGRHLALAVISQSVGHIQFGSHLVSWKLASGFGLHYQAGSCTCRDLPDWWHHSSILGYVAEWLIMSIPRSTE